MDYAKESLRLHEQWKGKIEVIATVPVEGKEALSLAYTPGVAQPCLDALDSCLQEALLSPWLLSLPTGLSLGDRASPPGRSPPMSSM